MTVIAWDGTTLAADREAGDSWIKCLSVVKIARIGACLAGCAGPAAAASEMMAWFRRGAQADAFPPSLREVEGLTMLVITAQGRVLVYQNTPHPIAYCGGEGGIGARFAIGAGRDAALAVMLAGHGARRAVEIASMVCAGCGNGVDTLELNPA